MLVILDQNKMSRLAAVRPRLPTIARGLLPKVVLDLEKIKLPTVGLVILLRALMQVELLRGHLGVVLEDLRTLSQMLELLQVEMKTELKEQLLRQLQ